MEANNNLEEEMKGYIEENKKPNKPLNKVLIELGYKPQRQGLAVSYDIDDPIDDKNFRQYLSMVLEEDEITDWLTTRNGFFGGLTPISLINSENFDPIIDWLYTEIGREQK